MRNKPAWSPSSGLENIKIQLTAFHQPKKMSIQEI